MRLGDVFVFGVDLVLFTYFTQIALNTTNMTVRIAACFAMTAEIFFMKQHLKMVKIFTRESED